jgi:hypothetical protein
VIAVLAVPPGIWRFALLGVFPLGAALVALVVTAVETRSRNPRVQPGSIAATYPISTMRPA